MDFGNQQTTEQITSSTPVLSLPLDDTQLNIVLNQVISESSAKLAEKKITERQDINRRFWRGAQVDSAKLDISYQTAHVDNIVYQNEENRIVLAASRVPEITLAPSKDDSELIEMTQRVQRSVRNRIDSNTIRRLIKDGLRHHDLDLIGIIKVRWDQNKGKNGDYVFELVDPKSVMFSARSKIVHDGFTAEKCDVIIHWIEEPTQLVLSKFPQKRAQLESMFGMSQLPQTMRYAEAHFSWYDQQGKLVEGVAWKYDNIIMGSTRTPYFDYQGMPWINPETGQIEMKQRNHFTQPRKPFILFSYQNLQDWVYDTTTPFEQAIKINSIVNRRERQITEISDRTVPKIIFSKKAFKSGDAEKYIAKMNNPKDHIQLTGDTEDIRKAVMVIQGNAPDRILYEDIAALRSRIDSLFNTHGTTRGDVRSGESGIARQIAREGDLTITDDIVDFVVERVVFEMASWAVHMMKMYYTTPRPIKNMGKDGEIMHDEVSSDDIDEDVEIIVKASATGPQERRANATTFANAKITDPYTFFEDMDVPQPKERTKRLISWQRGQDDFYRNYMQMLGIKDEQFDSAAKAEDDIEKIVNGKRVDLDSMPDTKYVQTIADYMQSPQYKNIGPEGQYAMQQHIAKMREMVNNQVQDASQQPQPQAAGIPAAAGPQGQPATPTPQMASG